MAIPTAPTLDSIVIEALRKSNAMENYQRAKTEWIEEIKKDIASRKDWKILESTATLTLASDTNAVALPTDFGKPVKVTAFITPAGGSTSERDLPYMPFEDLPQEPQSGDPSFFTIYDGSLYLDTEPDTATTTARLHYLVAINLIDATGSKANKIHREWRNALLAGLEFRAYVEKGDARQATVFQEYEAAILRLAGEDVRNRRTRRSAALRSIGGLPLGRQSRRTGI